MPNALEKKNTSVKVTYKESKLTVSVVLVKHSYREKGTRQQKFSDQTNTCSTNVDYHNISLFMQQDSHQGT